MTDYREQIPELREAIMAMEIVDTHEHLPRKESERDQNNDVLGEYLIHYFNRDLVSAGLSPEDCQAATDPKKPLSERWKLVEPYWEVCRYTGYGRSLDIAAQGIYGIDGIRTETIAALNDAYIAARKEKNHFSRVLKDLSKIRVSVLDCYGLDEIQRADRDFFHMSYNINALVSPYSIESMDAQGKEIGILPRSFQDWLDICDASIDKAYADGATSLKCSLAYNRTLAFPRVTFAEAEACWNAAHIEKRMTHQGEGHFDTGEGMENYIMHHILRKAERMGATIQFHTGLQEGNGNMLTNSNPALLANLLLQYTQLRFDLFHIGYPYMGETGALCKNFPNAFIDMCWAHIISPRASMLALDEWLDAVPYNKISAFGGDYCFVDGVYGHQMLARENVCKVLSRKVLAHEITTDAAVAIAHALFVDNPSRILNV